MSQPLSVLKFGGSSVASPERIHRVARIIAAHHKRGDRLVVVVSAMADTTDDLIDLAKRVSPRATQRSHKREMDMLLSSGERISMALLSMALGDLGLEALSFTGSQSGIITTNFHGEARIKDIRPIRIFESLEKGKISIVAGFQGVSEDKEITTLGRGGSDTSAVALGAKLGAHEVFIYTDVEGVYSADPRKVPEARKLSTLSARLAYLAASRGAQVLHHRCLEVALKYKVPVRVLSSFIEPGDIEHGRFFENGTRIVDASQESSSMENPFVSLVSKTSPVALLQIEGLEPEKTLALTIKLQDSKLSWISLRSFETGIEILCREELAEEFANYFKPQQRLSGLALVSLVGGGLTAAPEIIRGVLALLKSEGLNPVHVRVGDDVAEFVVEESASLNALIPRIHALSL
ncbi:MAG: aspartate kinase [Bdellovibrionota bacterium]